MTRKAKPANPRKNSPPSSPPGDPQPEPAAPPAGPQPIPPDRTPEQTAYLALLEGNTLAETLEALRLQYPEADLQKAVLYAMEQFRKAARQDPELLIGWSLAATQDLCRKMNSVGDYAGALKAIKLLTEIIGKANRGTKVIDLEPDQHLIL
jgi:hypothetical protein